MVYLIDKDGHARNLRNDGPQLIGLDNAAVFLAVMFEQIGIGSLVDTVQYDFLCIGDGNQAHQCVAAE